MEDPHHPSGLDHLAAERRRREAGHDRRKEPTSSGPQGFLYVLVLTDARGALVTPFRLAPSGPCYLSPCPVCRLPAVNLGCILGPTQGTSWRLARRQRGKPRWAGAGRWAAYRAVLTDPPGRDLCAADSDPRRHQRHSCLSVPIHVSGPHAIEVYVHSSPFRRLLVMRGRGQVAGDHLCSTSLPSRRRHRAPNHPVLFAEAGGRLLQDPGGFFFFFFCRRLSALRDQPWGTRPLH